MQTAERINYIKKWILDYCKSMPKEATTLVVGVSGGIDSSVVSTICALTEKKTIVLSMPIKQIKEQHNLSLKHQEWLKSKFKNVEFHLVTLDNVFNSFKNKKFKKETDVLIGFFGYEILCNLLNIKIKNQQKLNFYKGIFYKPETLIKIRKDIKVISSKKNQIYKNFFYKTKILSPFKLNINYKKYKKIFDLFSKKIKQEETYQIKI